MIAKFKRNNEPLLHLIFLLAWFGVLFFGNDDLYLIIDQIFLKFIKKYELFKLYFFE